MRTPKTDATNSPQKILKAIEAPHEVNLNVEKEGSSEEINGMLKGVQAFIGTFDVSAKCKIQMQLIKIESAVNQDGENKQPTNA